MAKDTSKIFQNIVCVGIGGGALYYIAKYYLLLGKKVTGFDLNKTDRTNELAKLGASIQYQNPDGSFSPIPDLILYSNALPDALIQTLISDNPGSEISEVGLFYDRLISDYTTNKLSIEQKTAFEKAEIAPLLHFPKEGLTFIGVTGTDGKTTTSKMIYAILRQAGIKTGLISTVGATINDKESETGLHTTSPSQQEIAAILMEMTKAECTHIILECTSHALKTGRMAGILFDITVITNITAEHLDFHKSIDDIITAKSLLFTKYLKPNGTAIVNADNEITNEHFTNLAQNTFLYTKEKTGPPSRATIKASDIKLSGLKTTFKVHDGNQTSIEYTIPLIGAYNVSNALAAILVGKNFKIPHSDMKKALDLLPIIPGRAQILTQKPFTVVVDFAHTPNSLHEILIACQQLKKTPNNKLFVVFGVAGKRDPHKRPLMGEAAATYADVTILTAEDPRSEILADINDAVERGWQKKANSSQQLLRFDDATKLVQIRRDAIRKSLTMAQKGDVVVITGKAHEQSLCFGTTEYPWNDIVETQELLKQQGVK